jgi:hypothetical protein
VAHGLNAAHFVRPDRLPRMADFVLWATRARPPSGPPALSAVLTRPTAGPRLRV